MTKLELEKVKKFESNFPTKEQLFWQGDGTWGFTDRFKIILSRLIAKTIKETKDEWQRIGKSRERAAYETAAELLDMATLEAARAGVRDNELGIHYLQKVANSLRELSKNV